MIKQFNFFLTVFSLFIFIFLNINAQEQTIPITQPTKEDPVVYKISEIPIKLEETSAFLFDLHKNVLKPDEIKNLETELNIILKNYYSLKAQTDSVKLEDQLTTELREFQQKWTFQKQDIEDWSDDVTNRTEKLEEQKKTLLKKKAVWLKTDSLAIEEKADENIVMKIEQMLDEFNKAEELTIKEINNSLTLQTKLSKQSVDVSLTLKKINDLILAKKREIFVRNAPPIWIALSSRKDNDEFLTQIKNIWDMYTITAMVYYTENKNSIVSSIILLLLLFVLVKTLRHHSKNLKSEDPNVIRALKVLQSPLSASILVWLWVMGMFYSHMPLSFLSLIRIILIIPLIAVLNRIINRYLKILLYFFALLYILQQLKQTAASDTEIERVLLLIINLFSVAGFIWLIAKKWFDKAFYKPSHQIKARFLIKTLLVLSTITLVANILGYVMLSLTLVNGILNSVYGIIILITAGLALQSIVIIFIRTNIAKSINVVKNYPEKIEKALAKTVNLIVTLLSIIIVLNNFGTREIVFEWLEDALNYEWTLGSFSISLGSVLVFIISIWLAVLVARFVRFILEGDILPRLNLARGVPGAVSTISTYVIIGFGIILAVMGAGIDLNTFALLAGALGVGIGFGLQDVVNNFISGLILIFERPIQVGDAVQVEDLSGRVTHIGIRSSTVKTWDGAEVIVPNGNLISNKLINWTLSDQRRRIEIKVGVAYGTDVSLVMETLLDCAKQNEKILEFPTPSVLFEDFADSSLNFELRCWARDFESWIEIRSEIRVAIDKAFKEKNIEIPFPQRDLHLKSGFGNIDKKVSD